MKRTAADYGNPAVIELSDGSEVQNSLNRQAKDHNTRRRSVVPRHLCRESASPVNSIAFVLLILSGILCIISVFSPMWIYYPKRYPVAQLSGLTIKYPFRRATWRGLWAVCYNLPDLNPRVVESQWPDQCVWFGSSDTAWKSIPSKSSSPNCCRLC